MPPSGWPYTARNNSYGLNTPVPSSNLNEMQDRIVDLHRIRTKVLFNAIPEFSGTSPSAIPGWYEIGGGHGLSVVQPLWRCQNASSHLIIPVELPIGSKVWKVEIKYVLNSATGIVFDLVSETPYFDTHGTDPSGALLGTVTPSTVGPDVATIDIDSSPHQITADDFVYILIHDADVGDDIYGARVTYTPITPTP